MKLILTADVANLGGPGDIVEVADGYGRNYLVPQGVAMRWTRGGEKQIDTIRRARQVREVRDLGHAKEIAASLAELTVTLPARAGAGGTLFGSVTAADIVEAVKAAGGPVLDRRKVSLPGHVKKVGTVAATVALHPSVSATIPVQVVAASS